MPARRADPRLGLFTTTVLDFGDDLRARRAQRLVNRWRLEKKDPAAEMSEPVKPITFWIDRNVPLQYRDTVRAAVLEWNKAFERIGFENAIVVQQQPDDADFDTLDFGIASVRWMMNATQFGRHRPEPRRPAQRRDPRRRHRLRRPVRSASARSAGRRAQLLSFRHRRGRARARTRAARTLPVRRRWRR
jgi:hypothetical protein